MPIPEAELFLFFEATEQDVKWCLMQEDLPENRAFLSTYNLEKFLEAVHHPDLRLYLLKEKNTGNQMGFVLLAGLESPNLSLEIRKILIIEKGKGYGRTVLQSLKKFCFETLCFHRLWLDVFEENERGLHLYQSEGFQVEGRLRECVLHAGTFTSLFLLSVLENEYRPISQ